MTPRFAIPDDARFLTTQFVVEAGDAERNDIWFRWCELGGVEFVQDNPGWSQEIALVAERPMRATVFWYIIAGARVAFVDLFSGWTWNREIAEIWFCTVFPSIPRWNALNFNNVISAIRREQPGKFKHRAIEDILNAVRSVPRRDI